MNMGEVMSTTTGPKASHSGAAGVAEGVVEIVDKTVGGSPFFYPRTNYDNPHKHDLSC